MALIEMRERGLTGPAPFKPPTQWVAYAAGIICQKRAPATVVTYQGVAYAYTGDEPFTTGVEFDSARWSAVTPNAAEVVAAATTQAGEAAASAAAAVASENNASGSASAAAADRVQCDADAVATAADRVQTGLDRAQTGLDAASSLSSKNAAAASEANALTYKNAAQTAQTNAETAETNAETAQAAAELAETGAQAAQTAAETARDAAFGDANVHDDIATGLAAVAEGEQFMVVEGDEIVRYKDNSGSEVEVARYPSAESVRRFHTQKLNLWPDPFFRSSAGDDLAIGLAGRYLYSQSYNNRSWDNSIIHPHGRGAWKYNSGSAAEMGFHVYFNDPDYPIVAGDVLSFGAIVKAPSGTVRLSCGFFSSSGASTYTPVGGQINSAQNYVTMDGTEKILKLENAEVPAGARGVWFILYDGTAADFHVLSVWANLGATTDSKPPIALPRFNGTRRMARFLDRDGLGGGRWAFLNRVSGSSSKIMAASSTSITAQSGFNGFGEAYLSAGLLGDFNAISCSALTGNGSSNARLHALVKTAASDANLLANAPIAVGHIDISPTDTTYSGLVIPLRDPVTGAFKTVTVSELSTEYYIHIWATKADGSMGDIDVPRGTMANRTSPARSYYTAGVVTPFSDGPTAYSGNPGMGLEQLMVSSPADDYEFSSLFKTKIEAQYGLLTSSVLTGPTPNEPVTSTRLYGIVNKEMNVYFDGLISSCAEKLFDVVASPATYGMQQTKRWVYTPVGAVSGVTMTFNVMDPNTLTQLGTGDYTMDVVAADAAAGATRTILCIGDSTTAAGTYTSRILSNAASNLDGVQPTLIGTKGSGSNKHEGNSGWTVAAYYQEDVFNAITNPFIQTPGTKFNFAHYLSNNSLASPDVVFFHLGINDVFSQTSDAAVNSAMDDYLTYLDKMIGVTADAAVGSIWESNADAKILIALPISPAATQEAFGYNEQIGQTRARYKRNITVASYRIREHYNTMEGDGIFLIPLNVVVDSDNNFPTTTVAVNDTNATTVERQSNSVHPAASGYDQMGDALWAALNVLVAQAEI